MCAMRAVAGMRSGCWWVPRVIDCRWRRMTGVTGMHRMRISRDMRMVFVRWFQGGHRIVTVVSGMIVRRLSWPFDRCRTTVCGVAVMAMVSCFHFVLHPVLSRSHRDWRRCHPMCEMFHARLFAVATVAGLVDDPPCLFLAQLPAAARQRCRPVAVVNAGLRESWVGPEPLFQIRRAAATCQVPY
jgi:hypothetical protein